MQIGPLGSTFCKNYFFPCLQSDKLPSGATLGPVTEVIIFFLPKILRIMFFDFVSVSGYFEAGERRLCRIKRMLRLLLISLNTPNFMHQSLSADFSRAKFYSCRLSPESRHLVKTRKLAVPTKN